MNAMGDATGGSGELVPLDVPDMVASAERTTGLSDFGDFDGDWRSRLDALVAIMEEHSRLNVVGRLMVREEILRSLRTRLRLTAARKANPKIAREKIEAPIVITGPGRSGTSILFELLSLDPAGHGPLGWEAAHPASPEVDPRELSRITECEQELWSDVNPVIATIHEHRADLPVECITLQIPSFGSAYWWIVANLPGWIPDMGAAMQYHRAALQNLQHGREPFTWILKTPIYLMMIDLLFATYPDAWVIRTHRDPVKTAVSGLSTMAAVRWQRSDHVELDSLGGPVGSGGGGTHDQMLAVDRRREAGELPDRFVDVHFSKLMSDPVATIRAAYDRIGRELTDTHATAIVEYLESKPRAKAGRHEYSPEDYGVDLPAMREASRPYMEHFGVAAEEY
jgi:hypothetical protein